jgi:hypothetical protein
MVFTKDWTGYFFRIGYIKCISARPFPVAQEHSILHRKFTIMSCMLLIRGRGWQFYLISHLMIRDIGDDQNTEYEQREKSKTSKAFND